MILKKIFTFLMLALFLYLIGSFINWELDIANWGGRTKLIYILGAVITAFGLIVEDA